MPGHSRQALKGQRRAEETVNAIQTQTQHKTHTTRHDTTQCAATEEENLFSLATTLSLPRSRSHPAAAAAAAPGSSTCGCPRLMLVVVEGGFQLYNLAA
jgi:hypothetical protein